MQQALTANRIVIRNKTITTAVAIVAAVALPQIFHAVGAVSGLGSALGETFLPMQLPVLLAGLLAGPFAGVVAAILSPLISFAISGMPGQAMLPYIMAELIGYGLAAGVLSKTKMPVIGKVLAAQIAGRIIRTGAILIVVYGLGSQTATIAETLRFIVTGLPGILLQLCLLPLVVFRIENTKKI